MNVDDPTLTAYALDELDEPERSAIARATAASPEAQRCVAEIEDLADALRSQYRLELKRGLIATEKLVAIRDDDFWSRVGPLAIAALLAILAVIAAVMFSSNESRVSASSKSSLPRDLAEAHTQPSSFAPVEAEDASRSSQNEKLEADAGPYAFTGERPFVSVKSRPQSSVPLVVNSPSYSDVRRSINAGRLPPKESVRIEEMINYFPYDYPTPGAGEAFSLNLDVVTCPWEPNHRLVRIGVKAGQATTVLTDSRIEVEFNAKKVTSYRLIGYDRQRTAAQRSNDENAGSQPLTAGYTLTAFYEIILPKRADSAIHTQTSSATADASEPLLTAEMQLDRRRSYAAAGSIQRAVSDTGPDFAAAPGDLKFAAAVAEFGMILRDSEFKGSGSLQQVLDWAQQGKGADLNGYRADFIDLVRKAQGLRKS
jgi:hypothetical protein